MKRNMKNQINSVFYIDFVSFKNFARESRIIVNGRVSGGIQAEKRPRRHNKVITRLTPESVHNAPYQDSVGIFSFSHVFLLPLLSLPLSLGCSIGSRERVEKHTLRTELAW